MTFRGNFPLSQGRNDNPLSCCWNLLPFLEWKVTFKAVYIKELEWNLALSERGTVTPVRASTY
jgi:hypothetical protein